MTSKHFDYVFTINNYEEHWIKEILAMPKARYIVMGEEIAPTTKTKHIQGYIYFETQKPLTAVIKIFKKYNNAHIEVRAKNSSTEKASNYCKKDGIYHEVGTLPKTIRGVADSWENIRDDIINGTSYTEICMKYPMHTMKHGKSIKEYYQLLKPTETYSLINELEQKQKCLYPYQQDILGYIENNKPDDRQIIWIYDIKGNTGKSSFAKHLSYNNNFIKLSNGKTADIAYMWNGENIIFDYARSQEKRINYEVIEHLKNGIITSTKYEGTVKKHAPPHIIVISNFKPETKNLSLDRWLIYNVNENMELEDITQSVIEEQSSNKIEYLIDY